MHPPLPPSPTTPLVSGFRRFATSSKLIVILLLAGLLQIPLWMIEGLLHERLERREQAVAEITGTWGHAQTLLFTAFFLFEVLSALRLHALHYLLVGGALCLFYLGLLSLSEFISFPAAYIAAALASALLVGGYSKSILRSTFRAGVITAALGSIYAFLFFVLQMQDYALFAGTVALFLVLGVVMYTTRKVDWAGQTPPAGAN